jgi:hypothetical protein
MAQVRTKISVWRPCETLHSHIGDISSDVQDGSQIEQACSFFDDHSEIKKIAFPAETLMFGG